MDFLYYIIGITMLVGPVAVIAAWLAAAGVAPLGELIHGSVNAADWWRGSMPWPHGVQEDDGVTWGTREMLAAEKERDPAEVIVEGARLHGVYVPMTRPRRNIRVR